jgi:hypothetical protein
MPDLGGGYALPAGGLPNQVITKESLLEGHAVWKDVPVGSGTIAPTLELPLTSMTNWTPEGGTWSSTADGISKTDAATTVHQRLRFGGLITTAEYVIECEMRMVTGPATNGNSRVGLALSIPNAGGSHGMVVTLASNGSMVTAINMETDTVYGMTNTVLASPIAFGTFVKMRIWVVGDSVTVWINDVLVVTGRHLSQRETVENATRYRFGLWTYQATGTWRNLKVWQLDPFRAGPRGLPGPQGNTMVGNTYIAVGPAVPTNPTQTPIWIKTGS